MAHRHGRTGHPSLIPGPESQQDKPHGKVSGGNATPGNRIKIIMAKRQPLNDQPRLSGGSRLSAAATGRVPACITLITDSECLLAVQ